MLTAVLQVVLFVAVFGLPFALIAVAGRVQRARGEVVARQIAVTDAIHRELGAIVAPVVRRRGRHTWTVAVAAPLDRSVAVGRMLALAYDALATERAGASRGSATPDVSFVVTPRAADR
jgi:hypothetical protein